MKKLIFLLLMSGFCSLVFAQNKSSIGFDMGGYAVSAPKHMMSGNVRNKYIDGGSSFRGIFYDRFICNAAYSIKTGVYMSEQFDALVSLHIPIEFNGNIFGHRDSTMFFVGYTGGIGVNIALDVDEGIVFLSPGTTNVGVDWKKNFYVAPQVGFNAGFNYWRISVLCSATLSFLVPEFAEFTTSFAEDNGQAQVQTNTNSNMGISIKLGVAYRF